MGFPSKHTGPLERGNKGPVLPARFLQARADTGPLAFKGERVRSGLPAKEQRDPRGANYAPDASTSNCLLTRILNIKQVPLADGEATTPDPPGGFHLSMYAFRQRKADTPSRFNETVPEEPKTVKTSVKGK